MPFQYKRDAQTKLYVRWHETKESFVIYSHDAGTAKTTGKLTQYSNPETWSKEVGIAYLKEFYENNFAHLSPDVAYIADRDYYGKDSIGQKYWEKDTIGQQIEARKTCQYKAFIGTRLYEYANDLKSLAEKIKGYKSLTFNPTIYADGIKIGFIDRNTYELRYTHQNL